MELAPVQGLLLEPVLQLFDHRLFAPDRRGGLGPAEDAAALRAGVDVAFARVAGRFRRREVRLRAGTAQGLRYVELQTSQSSCS